MHSLFNCLKFFGAEKLLPIMNITIKIVYDNDKGRKMDEQNK